MHLVRLGSQKVEMGDLKFRFPVFTLRYQPYAPHVSPLRPQMRWLDRTPRVLRHYAHRGDR